ncbi:hypothetical protein LX36DRAFT_265436 [Colletotrichum falcatum]|nr:hypothetical protein LX36DRAFT_265436 [Colletotrichum falcatum]
MHSLGTSHQIPLSLGNDTRPPMKRVSDSSSSSSSSSSGSTATRSSVSPPTAPRPRLFFALLSTGLYFSRHPG